MANEPKKLADVLATGSLAALQRESERRRLATAEIKKLLPAEEAAHLVSAVTNAAGELVLVMDTPAWAARVRYATANLPNPRVRIRVLPRSG